MNNKASTAKSALSVQTIVLASTAWAVISLLFFLLFSISTGQERPEWYSIVTYFLEEIAYVVAGFLCFRNWRSSAIVSGRTVWLAIGLGMFFYFVGNLFFAYWEVGLGIDPDVSPGDFFFIPAYVFLGWGILRAVMSKRLDLTAIQWGILSAIAVAGIAIAVIATQPLSDAQSDTQSDPQSSSQIVDPSDASISQAASSSSAPSPLAAEPPSAPEWAVSLESQLTPFSTYITWLYIVGDVILVVMATTLLLAFWGGRFALSWRFIAFAAFSYYIADVWFNYATNNIPNYQTGALPEVFWIFSGCLISIGAALEYDLSTRRRTGRRRG
ncbi:MAG: hypothetical protein KME15_02775 [Drouetiella hepatica Uher 2000/2452]|uniref:Uncharacterized protein n=1 Tax=Drouetiella hepatica Uher 2000/2452 TaxID=904376 RepID=A0A951ULE1_9CYAN|nr:hypothetical protein [Drouetiella hepatica Uher 2000/2452]